MTTRGIIHVENVSKIYHQGETDIYALNDVSVEFQEGEFVTLMGPSGSGKSTLLHIIAGVDRPTRGHVEVMGENIAELSEGALATWRNMNIGFVFQTFNLIPVLSALENVELPLLLTGLGARERRRHARLALELVGLGDRGKHRPNELSGGQQQRVAIARALVTDPPFIIADEPTGNLDAHSAQEALLLLQRLNRDLRKTVIMVTHDPKASLYGTRVIHLEKGELNGEDIVHPSEAGGPGAIVARHDTVEAAR
jgi:putative ABC transport system ATP-binding protein